MHLTEGLTGCAKYLAIRQMLQHAASSLPHGSFAHDLCRKHPPSIKIKLHIQRTVKHNIQVFKQNVATRMMYESFQNKCYKLFFVVALMAYPSASTRSLRIYQCDPIGDKFYLARDLSIECFDTEWNGKYSKRRRSNVAVIIVRIIFISSFLFYCLLLNHSFPINPNKITNCFQLILSITTSQLHCSCVAF
jgi:hypothetical protein